VRGGIDWARLLALAARHGTSPLLQRHLPSLHDAGVPKSTLAAVWARHEANRRRNDAMAAELARIVECLDAARIPVVPYKGPTLALAAYADPALREFGDLDLLVRARDVGRAREALRPLGYRAQNPLTPPQEAALLRSRRLYEFPLVDAERGRIVELHWRPDPEFAVLPLENDDWWVGLRTIELGGVRMRALPASELCLVLCLHGTKHFWCSLGWLVDVAELIGREPRIDWEWIAATSRRLGCERHLGLALYFAHELLQVAVPQEVAALTCDRTVLDLAAQIRRTLFEPDYQPFGVAEAFRWNQRLHRGVGRRARHAFDVAVMPGWGDWLQWRLPRALSWLYFPLRFGRLSMKYLFRARKSELAPRLEHHDRDGVRQVEAAVAGPHRQP